MEDEWLGGEEEDESLDNTLWMLESQGVIPGTPVTKEGRGNNTTQEVGGMEVEWDGDDDEDFWLSKTLQVQESKDDWQRRQEEEEDEFWNDPLSFLSQGSSQGIKKEVVSRLVTNMTSQEGVGGQLVLDQASPHPITLEEEAEDIIPGLPTMSQGPVTGLSVADNDDPSVGDMDVRSGRQEVMKTPHCVISQQDTHSLDGEMTNGERYPEESTIHTEPSMGSLDKEGTYDNHTPPLTTVVTTKTPLPHTEKTPMFKYYTRGPPPPATEKRKCSYTKGG